MIIKDECSNIKFIVQYIVNDCARTDGIEIIIRYIVNDCTWTDGRENGVVPQLPYILVTCLLEIYTISKYCWGIKLENFY